LVWYTSKAEAVSKATSEGKKILLVATYTDGYKTTAMNTLFESTSPPIHCLLTVTICQAKSMSLISVG
jgi:hypothetical protein